MSLTTSYIRSSSSFVSPYIIISSETSKLGSSSSIITYTSTTLSLAPTVTKHSATTTSVIQSRSTSLSTAMTSATPVISNTPIIYLSVQNDCELGASIPYSPLPFCSSNNQQACPIGDMIGKHGPLSSGRNLLTDLNLPLTGPNSGKQMII